MYRNLEAEQKRANKTNQAMAEILNVSRVTYERKKRKGNFTASECKNLCNFFKCNFEYLFAC